MTNSWESNELIMNGYGRIGFRGQSAINQSSDWDSGDLIGSVEERGAGYGWLRWATV